MADDSSEKRKSYVEAQLAELELEEKLDSRDTSAKEKAEKEKKEKREKWTKPLKSAFGGTANYSKSVFKGSPMIRAFLLLVIFLFMSMGYVSGYPLYIVAWLGGAIWGIFNWLAYQIPGLVPIPDFFFSSAAQFTKGSLGAILNGIFGYHIIKSRGKGFIKSALSITLTWTLFAFVFMVVYTGYIPLFGPSPIGLCGVHQSTNDLIGLDPISCDPYEIGIQSNRFSGQIESNNILNEILSPLEIKTDLGVAFKSDRIETEYIVNNDAGSALSNLRPFKDTFTSFGSDPVLAEDIILMGNLKSKTLFIEENAGENFVKIKLTPAIGETQCTCAGNVACVPLSDESVNTFQSISTEHEYTTNDVNTWCSMPWTCDIPGSEKIGENEFKVRSGYNQQVRCTHDGIAIDEDKLYNVRTDRTRYSGLGKPFFVDLGISYATSAVATKQLFVIDRGVVETQQDPLEYLSIDSGDVISKSLTDGKIEFGIGLDQNLDYLVPTYPEDSSPNIILLGVSIENPRFSNGDVTNLNMDLKIYPDTNNIQFICGSPDFDKDRDEKWTLTNSCTDGETSGNFIFEGRNEDHYAFS